MRYSQLFINTFRADPKDETAISARLLLRGSFIDKLMAGSYTFLPLGWRVKNKIENICREEINAIGGQEILMPLLHPKEIWNETGRWSDKAVKQIMYQFSDSGKKEFGLSFTHEEIFLDVVRKISLSRKNLPIKMYHFSTKFRNETRVKSGLLRGREFIMKDLYSLHPTQEDLDEFYWRVKDAYIRIFNRIGLNGVKVVEAAGGVFTSRKTHEFQLIHPIGEDTIYYCSKCDWAENKEIYSPKIGSKCPKCSREIQESSSIEIGNIFRFGTVYSEKMKVNFKDSDGAIKPSYLGSYGIGIGRVMASIVEIHNDDRGIVWPKPVAPFLIHLVSVGDAAREAEKIHKEFEKHGVEILWDDRDESAGVKFADADLIGAPYRIVVSEKSLLNKSVEVKKRSENKASLVKVKDISKFIEEILE